MNVFIRGDDKFGAAEDFVEFRQDGNRKLLTFVVDGRDVDEQISKPPGLTQSDFPDEAPVYIADLTNFQDLIDARFEPGHNLATWFACGLEE